MASGDAAAGAIETAFFSFSTTGEDFHGPNAFFRRKSFRDGLRLGRAFSRRSAAPASDDRFSEMPLFARSVPPLRYSGTRRF
jgi:hypothetical protein